MVIAPRKGVDLSPQGERKRENIGERVDRCATDKNHAD